MKKLVISVFSVSLIMFVISSSAYAQSVEEMRESGTLLVFFVVLVSVIFYVFGMVLAFVSGTVEKRLDEKKSATVKRNRTRRATASYSVPYAQGFMTNQANRRIKRKA